jgi:hypothetical protein
MNNKIRETSADKIRGKLVKYRQGDCLIIKLSNGKYLGALITGKFNAYYNFTFMDFYKETKPELTDFLNGQFFGTRFGSWEDLTYAVDQRMIKCKYVDSNEGIEKIGEVTMIHKFISAGYSYLNSVDEILDYYLGEIPVRTEKSKDAEKFPAIAFVSRHLIEMKKIVQ